MAAATIKQYRQGLPHGAAVLFAVYGSVRGIPAAGARRLCRDRGTILRIAKGGEPVRSEFEVDRAVEQYSDMIKRICLYHLKNAADTEDVFQTVFLKYLLYEGSFEGPEHEKAWLIRVTLNACKDYLKSFFRHSALPLEELAEEAASIPPKQTEVLDAVLALPAKYKDAIYLHYYEGYSAWEISRILGKKENTVYSLLSRGRTMLKDVLGGDL